MRKKILPGLLLILPLLTNCEGRPEPDYGPYPPLLGKTEAEVEELLGIPDEVSVLEDGVVRWFFRPDIESVPGLEEEFQWFIPLDLEGQLILDFIGEPERYVGGIEIHSDYGTQRTSDGLVVGRTFASLDQIDAHIRTILGEDFCRFPILPDNLFFRDDYQYLVTLPESGMLRFFRVTRAWKEDLIQRDSILEVPGVVVHGWMDPDIVPLRYLDEVNQEGSCEEWVTLMGW